MPSVLPWGSLHPGHTGTGKDEDMSLTPTQTRVAEALELGSTIDDCIAQGLCSRKSVLRWNVQAMREEYRATIAPPRLDVRRELDRLTPEAIQAVAACLRGTGKQTQLLAARFVLEAAMEAEADTPTGEDGAVAELRALLSVA